MSIQDHEGSKLTPREAAKRIVERELEGCYYWQEHDSSSFYADKLTAREKQLIHNQVDKIIVSIRKQLRRKL